MSNGNRSTPANLFPENRYHRARGSDHIAESNGQKPGGRSPVQILNDQLGYSLRCAHHRTGPDRLVSRYKDKRAYLKLISYGTESVSRQHVVFDGFGGVVFHHGHVLVGGGVNNELRSVRCKNRPHPGAVADVSYKRHNPEVGAWVA